MVGESYKKVKFSDFIYMQRVRDDLTLFSSEVVPYVFYRDGEFSSESPQMINLKDDLTKVLKPLEMRVSKSKEKGKGFSRFMLFCSQNLRLYNTVKEYLDDVDEIRRNNKIVDQKIEKVQKLANLNVSLISETLMSNPIFDDEQIALDWN